MVSNLWKRQTINTKCNNNSDSLIYINIFQGDAKQYKIVQLFHYKKLK